MPVSGTPSADGSVHVSCPGCKAELRVHPRSSRTTVPCAACGEKFVLELPDGPPKSGTVPPPPPPRKDKEGYGLRADDAGRDTPPPRPRRDRADRRDDGDRPRRRKPEPKPGAPIGLIVGGGVAVLLVLGGVVAGAVYALRDREPAKAPPGPAVAAASTTTAPTPEPIPLVTPATTEKPPAKAPDAGGKTTPIVAPPKADPKPKPVVKDDPKPADPDATDPEPKQPKVEAAGETPPKKGGPRKGPAVGGGKEAIERVKNSTALVEIKLPDGSAHGTGFVVRPGIVMTNHHVIKGALVEDIRVSFVSLDDTAPVKLKATLLYADPKRDLVALRVDTDRPPLDMVERGTELSGMDVAVVGNPADRNVIGVAAVNKVTTGRLSAPVRAAGGWTYYELAAEAYFGNSGGPVVDRRTGKLVGVMQSIAGDGKIKSYCIPFGEVSRALEAVPANREDEPKATKVALARHYLDYLRQHISDMEHNAELAMEGQLNRLRAKSFGGTVNVTVTRNGQSSVYSLAEFMDLIREKHKKTYPVFTRSVLPAVGASPEIPSALKSATRLRVDTYLSMYGLADASTTTEKAFLDAMDSRKAANVKAAKAFQEAFDKFLDELERNPLPKAK